MLRARIEPDLKARAEAILDEIGLSPTVAVNILYRRIVAENGFPIPMHVYNDATLRALDDARNNNNLRKINSVYDILEEDNDENAAHDESVQEGPPPRK